MELTVRLYDPSQNLIDSQTIYPFMTNLDLPMTLTESGTHYIVVEIPFSFESLTVNYDFNLARLDAPLDLYEPNDSIEMASVISYDQMVEARAEDGTDLDFFQFTAAPGDVIQISAWGGQVAQYLSVTLYDSAQNEVQSLEFTP